MERGDLTVDRLIDLELIKQLKARYFRLMDRKDWDAFPDLFTEDCRHYPDVHPGDHTPFPSRDTDGTQPFTANDAYFPMMKAALTQGVTTHHGHMPEITCLSDTEAEGIWTLFNYIQVSAPRRICTMVYSHYFETYRKCDDGKWRISSKRNHWLRLDQVPWTLPEPSSDS